MKFVFRILVIFLAIFVLCWANTLIAQTNVPPPTLADLQADFEAQKYQDVIKKSQRVLSVKGDPTKQTDRAAIEALKGEAQLHLKQFQPAAESFTAAGKDATDAKQIGEYRAIALLVKRSPGGHYTPKPVAGAGEKPEAIDIVAADSRKKAFVALYSDESKVVQRKVDATKQKQALKPMMDLTHDVLDLRAVEIAGTGTGQGTSKMLAEISNQAAKLMGDAVSNMKTTVDKIAKTANEQYNSSAGNTGYGQGQVIISKRGLSSTDKKTLEEVIANCKEIEGATEQFEQGEQDIGAQATRPAARGGGTSIATVKKDAADLGARVDQILNGDYSDRDATNTSGARQQQQQGQQQPGQQQRPNQPPPKNN